MDLWVTPNGTARPDEVLGLLGLATCSRPAPSWNGPRWNFTTNQGAMAAAQCVSTDACPDVHPSAF